MIQIPPELLEQFERGNVLLFIGERVGRDAEGHILVDQLVTELATRCEIDSPEEYTFPEMAQIYEDEMGRNSLVQLVRDQLEALGEEPKEVHRLIAGLTQCTVLVTTGLDRRLERSFEEIGRPFDLIIGNVDLPFVGEGKTQLYKLRGSVERVESLVLTEADYETFFEDQASISVVLRSELARKTTVFAGYDLSDQHFTNLYRKVTAGLDNYARRAYAFGEAPSAKVYRWCKRNNIQVIEVHATTYLQELAKQLQQIKPQPAPVPLPAEPQPPTPIPERPYKLLDSYQARDEAIFYGRAQETGRFTSLIHAHRLTLLYGASGTGKTSLLQAGVLPQLERADPPYATIRVRALEDPALVIRRAVQRQLPEADLPEDGSLVEFLDAAAQAIDHTLVIVLDQFEEFFIRFSPKYRTAFSAELARLYEARNVPVKVVFSLREDWLASMSEIEERIPEVYQTKMRLLPLSRDQARQAITGPAEQLGIRYDQGLVDRLLDDLVDGQADDELTGSQSASVMPPQLQLVCDALYDRARSQGRNHITIADYEAMGGAQDILARYIQEALREHPGEEREVAKRVLGSLVSSQATKTAIDQGSISAEVGAGDDVVERVLSRLIRQRLVRRLDVGPAYELAHDILADAIAGWIGDEDRQLKQAREMLRRELADWQQDPAVLVSRSKFQRINTFRDGLRLTEDEAVFLLRASVLYDEDVPYWLKQISEPDTQAHVLIEMLKSDDVDARLTAAKYLGDYPRDDVATALASTALEDAEPVVQDTAAVSLGHMGGREGIRLLVDSVSDTENAHQAQAVHALALIQDVAPDQLVDVAGPTRRQATYELARVRFGRNWPRIRMLTAFGAIGGTVGFGLGLALPITLNTVSLTSVESIRDIVFIAPLLAVFGLLAGAVMAVGISTGEAVFGRRPRVGRILGGALLGGLGFAVFLAPLAIVDATAPPDAVLRIVGGGLFGMLIGLGTTVPGVITPRRVAALVGGAVGGSLGIVIWGALGFKPFHPFQGGTVPLSVLLVSGGQVGLSLALSIVWAEARWPRLGRDSQQTKLMLNQVKSDAAI